MKKINFQESIHKTEVYQQIKLMAAATFENYNVKKIESFLIEELELPEDSLPLKIWYESKTLLKVRLLGEVNTILDAEMIILAMDFLSILGLAGLNLQVNKKNDKEALKKFLELASFDYDFSELEELDFLISLPVGGERLEVCKSVASGFDFDLESLQIALEEQEVSMVEEVKLHAYVAILLEEAEFEAHRLVLSLRQQGYSVDRNYHITDSDIEKKLLENPPADLLIVLGEETLKSQRLRVRNTENQKASDCSISEICSNFSDVYEKIVMSF